MIKQANTTEETVTEIKSYLGLTLKEA